MPELIDVEGLFPPVEREPEWPPAPNGLDWLRRNPRLSPRLRRLLEVQQPTQLRAPPLIRPEEVRPQDVTPIGFGLGMAKGIIATIRRRKDPWGYGDVPEPRNLAESLGFGFMSPLDPHDPMVASMVAFPPGSAIERGLAQAISQGRQLAGPAAGLAVQSARRTAAQAPGLPGAARLRVAGVRPVHGGAVPDDVLEIMRRAEQLAAQEQGREAATAYGAAVTQRPELYGFPPKVPAAASGALTRPPPGAVPVGAPPPSAKPGTMTPAIAQRLLEAQAIAARDRPGTLTRILDMLPGPRQALRKLVPALDMSPQLQASWIADGRALALVESKGRQGLRSQVALIESIFGKSAAFADDFKPKGVRYIGTEAQRGRNPTGDITGTMADILERPQLYEMSDAKRNAVRLAQEPRSAHFDAASTDYGLAVKAFPVQPGGMHLAHVDASQDAIAVAGSLDAALARGRFKPRTYPTLAERMQADPTFKPVTSIVKLLMADDATLARAAGRATFLQGSGGLTRLEVMEKIKPDLASKMRALQGDLATMRASRQRLDKKLAEAIDDFLASPVEDADLDALQQALEPVVSRGRRKGLNIPQLDRESAKVRADLAALRERWRNANTKPYAYVDKPIYRYYLPQDAEHVRRLLERSHNSFLRFLDDLRMTAFGGDLSPITIQGTILWLSDPVRASRLVTQGGRLFSEEALAQAMTKDPKSWGRFTAFTGIDPLQGPGSEFATGFVGKTPKVGKYWEQFNERMYRPLMWGMKQEFDASYADGLRRGLAAADAGALAADNATKKVFRLDYRRLGWSEAEYARYRGVVTSVSFFTQPAALMNDAAKGLLKMGLKQTITPTERFAVQRVLTLTATIESIAVASNVLYAEQHGLDIENAVWESLNPASSRFMSVILPNGSKFGLGGPFRAIIRAIAPQKVDWAPVPVPFAGLYNFANNKLGPGVRIVLDELTNRDYAGEEIRNGQFPVNILQGLEYAFRGGLPLTAGEAMKQARKGAPLAELGAQVGSQFMGTNYVPESLTHLRKRIAAEMYPLDPEREPWRRKEPYWGLKPTQRKKVDAHPLVKLQIDSQKDDRSISREAIDAAYAQFYDGLSAHNDAGKAAYKDLVERRQATAAGKLKAGDAKALSPEQFREALKAVARDRRKATTDAIAAFDEFRKQHPRQEWDEANPDALVRERFLNEYNNLDFLDRSTGAWDYGRRDFVKASWEQIHGAEAVRRWLQEGDEDIPPMVKAWWDGLEKYRDYFTVREKLLARLAPETRREIELIEQVRTQGTKPGLPEALKRQASQAVQNFDDAVLEIRKDMRRAQRGRFAGLDRWLYDYGYTPTTLAEQEARER